LYKSLNVAVSVLAVGATNVDELPTAVAVTVGLYGGLACKVNSAPADKLQVKLLN
jgi:hypothetical protein